MGYPKQPTEAQRKETLDQLASDVRRDLSAAAFLRDRAEQYTIESGARIALNDMADALEDGEHFEAFRHGELDDLVDAMMRRRGDRRKARDLRSSLTSGDAPGGG